MKSNFKKCLIFLAVSVCIFSVTACEKGDVSTFSKSDILIAIVIVLLLMIFFTIINVSSQIKKKIEHSELRIKSDKIVSNAELEGYLSKTVHVEKNEIEDLELVAVITAAIAAAEGVSSDAFVVRSIKKANKNKWQRA